MTRSDSKKHLKEDERRLVELKKKIKKNNVEE
jgi:hypothetical protein